MTAKVFVTIMNSRDGMKESYMGSNISSQMQSAAGISRASIASVPYGFSSSESATSNSSSTATQTRKKFHTLFAKSCACNSVGHNQHRRQHQQYHFHRTRMEQNPHADSDDCYRFGIELEYRLRLREGWQRYPDPQKLRDHLAKLWNEAGEGTEDHIPMKSGSAMGKAEGFSTWNLVDEHSMDESKDPFTFRLELVSPIFRYKDRPTWAKQIKRLIDHVIRYTIPQMDDTTGFHIHVSPTNGRWSLLDLKRLAEAIVYFDEPLKKLFPEHKYTKAFLKSNLRHNQILGSLSPDQSASSLIHNVKTTDGLIYVINPPQGNSMFSQRRYAWNFTNNSDDGSVCHQPKYTVEFRSPRSTTALNLIEQWIAFTVTFLHGSVSSPENIHNDFAPTTDGLNGFLYHNRPPGSTDDNCWEKYLSKDEMDRVLQGVGHYTVED